MKQKFSLLLGISLAYGTGLPNSSAPNKGLLPASSINQVGSAPVHSGVNLTAIDSNADDLIQLKRKLELEKAQAEIKKLRGGTNNVNTAANNAIVQDSAQTTVTGVAINQEGKKIAWLQFADGGSLTVNIGSRIGAYIVSDITMSGVRLSSDSAKSSRQSIFLKRAYYAPEKSKSQANTARPFFSPSPVITSANDGDDMVPPIISTR